MATSVTPSLSRSLFACLCACVGIDDDIGNATEQDPTGHVFFANRSACYIELGSSEWDCAMTSTSVLTHLSSWLVSTTAVAAVLCLWLCCDCGCAVAVL